MQEVYELVHKVAATKATVLILGESGVGKELVANAIHYQSPNADGPLVKFNCAALPENIVESELFGHEKGAFTGAATMRKGRFEQADGGTIFLDEVGELSLPIQAKLLRVLQERAFERVGGNRPVKVGLRIIAATNRDLPDMVAKGTFREDLYYRLNVFPITVPPLRERGSDVILLADYFAARYSAEGGKEVKRISTPALNMLMAYHWPGNVRELENVMERSVILSDDAVIHGYNLPPSLQTSAETGTAFGCSLEAKIHAVEYEMIVETLKTHNGNMTEAAKELGLTRRILGLRMEKHDISYKTFRRAEAHQQEIRFMTAPTENQQFHMILADIAMMAAINTFDRQSAVAVGPEYLPWIGAGGLVGAHGRSGIAQPGQCHGDRRLRVPTRHAGGATGRRRENLRISDNC